MYLHRCYRAKDGKRHAYWALVQSVRTARGPRQKVVAYLGELDEEGRLGVAQGAQGRRADAQGRLFAEPTPRLVQVDVQGVRVERSRGFGGPWLGLQILKKLGLMELMNRLMPPGREEVPWPAMAALMVLCRLCEPSSELHIAEHFYEHSSLADVLGVPAEKINEDQLYRALDQLLPHKSELETHPKNRMGQLFKVSYDLLLYDLTSTYFEGQAEGNALARRGDWRDGRGDCKQVVIGRVVSRCGLPLGYQVLAGNRCDVTTLEEIVGTMESRYGKVDRIWAMDRGLISQEKVAFLKEGGRRYIVGTPKGMLKRYQAELASQDWK